MNISYYKAIRNDDNVASEGDIIKVDWDRDSDGTPADNLTRGTYYCPFRTSDKDGIIMEKISEAEAEYALLGDPKDGKLTLTDLKVVRIIDSENITIEVTWTNDRLPGDIMSVRGQYQVRAGSFYPDIYENQDLYDKVQEMVEER